MFDNKHLKTIKIHNGGQTISLFDPNQSPVKGNRKGRLHVNGQTAVIGLDSGLFLDLDSKDFYDLYAMMKGFVENIDYLGSYKLKNGK